MNYRTLLKNAPDHDSDEFIDYLRQNNHVIFDNSNWIVIENTKYHLKDRPWLTAFYKPKMVADKRGVGFSEWWENIGDLWHRGWDNWEWRKKKASKQTVKRFHIHLIK